MFGLFIPIGIMVDFAEKIDKFRENEVPGDEIIGYYIDFIWYFGSQLYPVFLFLAVIWFTSRLANNTEVTAILSSGVSFQRLMKPYFISASIVVVFALISVMFIVPKSNKNFNEFISEYIKSEDVRKTSRLFKQINENEFIYISSYDPRRKRGFNFTLENFNGNKLNHKISASNIRWDDSIFRLTNYVKRTVFDDTENIERYTRKDTIFDFQIDDLAPVSYKAETLTLIPLNRFIKKEKEGGSVLINSHLLVRHKRWSLPLSSFVLTLIAVSVSSFKKRGGMGVNLAFGITLGFTFIFFDKIFSVLVNKSNFSPLLGAWLPIILFGSLAFFMLKKASR